MDIQPITRKELYYDNIIKVLKSEEPKPMDMALTYDELWLQNIIDAIGGEADELITYTRLHVFYSNIVNAIGGYDVVEIEPLTREEVYLKAIADKFGGEETELPSALTREEVFLAKIYELAEGGGGVQTTVTGYPLTLTASTGKPIVDYKIYGNSKQDVLPAGYIGLEYIESSGTQFINTGITVDDTHKFKAYLDYEYLHTANGYLGADAASSVSFRRATQDILLNGATTITGFNDRHQFYIMANYGTYRQAEYNGTTYTSELTVTASGTPFILFAMGKLGTTQVGIHKARLYRCKIWVDDVLVRDFLPYRKVSGEEKGLYDLVTATDYKNRGSGQFIDSTTFLPSPTEPRPITYTGTLVTSGEHQGKYAIPIKVEKGTDTTVTEIYLNEPLRKIGEDADYIDYANGKVVRVIGKYDMGDTTYAHATLTQGELFEQRDVIPNANAVPQGTQPPWACEAYTPAANNVTYRNYIMRPHNTVASYAVINSNYTDPDTFAQAMSGVYLYYKLATPVEETIELPEIATYKGDNVVTVNTGLEPSSMTVTYLAKE